MLTTWSCTVLSEKMLYAEHYSYTNLYQKNNFNNYSVA